MTVHVIMLPWPVRRAMPPRMSFITNVVVVVLVGASGAHLGYISSSPVFHSALGDYYAAVVNKYSGHGESAPGAVQLENLVVRWAADQIGYPSTARGVAL